MHKLTWTELASEAQSLNPDLWLQPGISDSRDAETITDPAFDEKPQSIGTGVFSAIVIAGALLAMFSTPFIFPQEYEDITGKFLLLAVGFAVAGTILGVIVGAPIVDRIEAVEREQGILVDEKPGTSEHLRHVSADFLNGEARAILGLFRTTLKDASSLSIEGVADLHPSKVLGRQILWDVASSLTTIRTVSKLKDSKAADVIAHHQQRIVEAFNLLSEVRAEAVVARLEPSAQSTQMLQDLLDQLKAYTSARTEAAKPATTRTLSEDVKPTRERLKEQS